MLSFLYNIIAADLIKRNSLFLAKELAKKGVIVEWPETAKKICVKEIRSNPLPQDMKRKIVAGTGFIWSWLRDQPITTREIYILLVNWLLSVESSVHTKEFDDLCSEFGFSIEAGYNGTDGINKDEIQAEWAFIEVNYLEPFKEMINDISEDLS